MTLENIEKMPQSNYICMYLSSRVLRYYLDNNVYSTYS